MVKNVLSGPKYTDLFNVCYPAKWFYSATAFNLRFVNYGAIMGQYQLFFWENMATYIELLPENKKSLS